MADRKITGTFCERKGSIKSKGQCATGSFRYRQSGKAWILLCCPKHKWHARQVYRVAGRQQKQLRGKCDGMRAYRVLVPVAKGKRCKPGEKRIQK